MTTARDQGAAENATGAYGSCRPDEMPFSEWLRAVGNALHRSEPLRAETRLVEDLSLDSLDLYELGVAADVDPVAFLLACSATESIPTLEAFYRFATDSDNDRVV
jgi:hypothetical protein